MPQVNKPTEEQEKIIRDEGNVVVAAKPGSGKTFTIVEKIKNISQTLYDYQGIIAISFTRKASNELKVRCKNNGVPLKQSFYGTIDSFYISQIITPFSRHLTNKLISFDIRNSVKDVPAYSSLSALKQNFTTEIEHMLLTSLSDGYIFLDICGETALYILGHVKEAQEYLVSKYTHIFVDEYQDCGYIQHKIFMLLINLGMIGVAVGDINQAIYAFSNRYPKYLIELLNNKEFTSYEITKNHRCHKSISDYSLKLLGVNITDIEQDKRVYKVNINGDEKDIANSIAKYLDQIKNKYKVDANNEVAILCRSNSTAKMIFENIGLPCKLFEDTELDKLNAYWARFFSDFLQCYFDETTYAVDLVEKYFDEEAEYKKYYKALSLLDFLFHLSACELKDNIDDLVSVAEMVYPEYKDKDVVEILKKTLSTESGLNSFAPAQKDEINILSLHKSKGLEFDIVFHLDLYQYIMPPYKYSDEDWTQSLNLHYVGITRARKVCYIMQGTYRHNSTGEIKEAYESEFLTMNGLCNYRKNVRWKI